MKQSSKRGKNIPEKLSGTEISAELNLKAAISLVNEVTEQIESVKRASEVADDAWDAGFWKGINASFDVGREKGAVLGKLEQAISLASSARLSDSSISVIQEEGRQGSRDDS